jgi:hypothetical protein
MSTIPFIMISMIINHAIGDTCDLRLRTPFETDRCISDGVYKFNLITDHRDVCMCQMAVNIDDNGSPGPNVTVCMSPLVDVANAGLGDYTICQTFTVKFYFHFF